MTNWPEEIATAETANLPDQLKVFANNESALKTWALAQPDCTHHASGDGIEIPNGERASMEARVAMSDAGYTNNVSWQDFIGLYHLASANENACQDREEAGKYAAGLDCLVKRVILGYGAENNRMKALEQLLIDEPSRQTEAPPEATTQATTGTSHAADPAAQAADANMPHLVQKWNKESGEWYKDWYQGTFQKLNDSGEVVMDWFAIYYPLDSDAHANADALDLVKRIPRTGELDPGTGWLPMDKAWRFVEPSSQPAQPGAETADKKSKQAVEADEKLVLEARNYLERMKDFVAKETKNARSAAFDAKVMEEARLQAGDDMKRLEELAAKSINTATP
ncbi:hypothetical protein [Streptomyces sp. NPDC055085]